MTDNIATEPAKLDPPAQQESAGEVTQLDKLTLDEISAHLNWDTPDWLCDLITEKKIPLGAIKAAFISGYRARIQSTAALEAKLAEARDMLAAATAELTPNYFDQRRLVNEINALLNPTEQGGEG